jgi:hypothetical protein
MICNITNALRLAALIKIERMKRVRKIMPYCGDEMRKKEKKVSASLIIDNPIMRPSIRCEIQNKRERT